MVSCWVDYLTSSLVVADAAEQVMQPVLMWADCGMEMRYGLLEVLQGQQGRVNFVQR
jgi:hypothetical protein